MSSEFTSPAARAARPRPPSALTALAAAMRELTETMLCVETLPEALGTDAEAARAQLESLNAALGAHAVRDRVPRLAGLGVEVGEDAGSARRRPYYVEGAQVGPHHPASLAYTLEHGAEASRGRVRFGVTHEGPPGCVHGGLVAHFFDEVLGSRNLAVGTPGMTASLTVRYRRPTPLLTDLEVTVESEVLDARKVRGRGRLALASGEVVAEGEGLFVRPRTPDWLREGRPEGGDAEDAAGGAPVG